MQMSSATADHRGEAAEYYEVSVRQKYKTFPRGHRSNVTVHRFFWQGGCGFARNNMGGLGEDEVSPWATGRCQEYLFKHLMHHQ